MLFSKAPSDGTACSFPSRLTIELDWPRKARVEPIDKSHADTVALLDGPLVLFGIKSTGPTFTRAQLRAAEQISPHSRPVQSAGTPMSLLPFFVLAAEPYSAYSKVS